MPGTGPDDLSGRSAHAAGASATARDGRPGDVPTLDERTRTLLALLASAPRPAGSAAEARARARCADWLTEHGFGVVEQTFDYSALPGRWGTPLVGATSLASLGAVVREGAAGRPVAALALLAVVALLLAVAGRWVARRGVLHLPAMRRTSINLVATRGARPPDVWLTAHLDSKSQPVPIALRAAGVIGTLAVWVVTAGLLVAGVAGAAAPTAVWAAVLAAGVLCAVPVIASLVGERSDGALDNASGVAAVLAAAALLPADPEVPVGLVITSAEELGLAGARVWAAGMAPATALNCDGVDDGGETVAMYSGRPPARLLDALADAAGAAAAGGAMRVRRLVPGILTDHVALADAGWATVTVSRGTTATLRRIHTRSDSLARLRGDGLMPVASLLAGAAARLARVAGEPPAAGGGGDAGGRA